jgi:glycosyltransferase involved in cell wall biosynthesis
VTTPRFAIASPNFHPVTCGVGDHSVRLAVELRRRGFEAEIFTRTPSAPHPEAVDVPVHDARRLGPLGIAEQIRRAVVRGGFSHLILQYVPHMWGASRFGSAGPTWLALGAKRAGLDVTVIAHELFTELVPRPDLFVGAALQRAQLVSVARAADRLLVTTGTRVDEVMPYLRAAGRHERAGVVRIGPNALPVPRVGGGRARLGLFSTAATNKRFDVVLGAFEHVWRRRPDAELLLIGDIGGRENRQVGQIREAVERHPARERIQLTGKLALAAVARRMADLDVYLFPMTTGANTRSGTLPVALGAGLPVVTLDGSQTDHDLFRDEENVLFATGLSAEAFGAAALRILEDPALAARLSAGARRLYDEHLCWPVVVDRLLAELGGAGAAPAR